MSYFLLSKLQIHNMQILTYNVFYSKNIFTNTVIFLYFENVHVNFSAFLSYDPEKLSIL